MSDKPRRQRRSYSCGPCKGLKVKCDMQLPCATCIKFHRVDKCHELPPNPPSAAELSKINQRKLVYMNRKRRREEVEILSNPQNQYHNTYPMHQLHHLQHIPIQEPMILAPQMVDPLSIPIQYTAYQIQYPHPIVHAGSSRPIDVQLPQPHQLHPPHQQSHQHHVPLQMPHNGLHVAPGLGELAMASPQAHTHAQAQAHAHPHPNSHNHLHPYQPMVPLGHQFQGHFHSQIPSSTPVAPVSSVLNQIALSPVLSKFAQPSEHLLSEDELREIKLYLPQNINYFNSLIDRFSGVAGEGFLESLNIAPRARFIFLQITDPKNPMSAAENLTADSLNIMAKLFIALVNGLNMSPKSYYNSGFLKVNLHSNEATINKWIQLARKLRDKVIIASSDIIATGTPEEARIANIKNARFVLEWYLLLKSYFHNANRIHDNFEEFIRSVHYIRDNEHAMELLNARTFSEKYILGKAPLDDDSKFLVLCWFKMRMVEVEFPFLQINGGSLFVSGKLSETIIPSEKYLNVVHTSANTDVTQCSLFDFEGHIWRVFHRNNLFSKDNYTLGILEAYMLCFKDLNLLVKVFRNAESVRANLIQSNEGNVLKTHAALFLFSRGSLIMKVDEHTYFPLLRVASYLTTQLNKFNFLLYVEQQQRLQTSEVGFIDKFMIQLSFRCYSLSILLVELINQLLYLATLFNYLALSETSGRQNSGLLSHLATLTYDRFQQALKLVKQSRLQTFSHVSFYAVGLSMIEIIIQYIQEIQTTGPFCPTGFQESNVIMFDAYCGSKSESVANGFTKYLRTHCSRKEDWQCFIVGIFGTADTLTTQIEQLWETFTFITERTPNGDIAIVEGLTLNVNLVDEIRNNFLGLEFDENTIKEFISTLVDEKNIIQQHSPFTDPLASTARNGILPSTQVPNQYGLNHLFLAVAPPK